MKIFLISPNIIIPSIISENSNLSSMNILEDTKFHLNNNQKKKRNSLPNIKREKSNSISKVIKNFLIN